MTYGIKTVAGVVSAETKAGFFGTKQPLFGANWAQIKLGGAGLGFHKHDGWTVEDLWTYGFGCHLGHLTEFCVALLCWVLLFSDGQWLVDCKEWRADWVAKVVGFNLMCEIVFCGFWHWLTYVSNFSKQLLQFKFNQVNQYEKNGASVRMLSSSSGQLEREVFYTTLGWLQSAMWQCVVMWLWASERLPCYTDGWAQPTFTVGFFCAITYWREIHFYWCHRGMHPWWDRRNGLMQGDVGACLYRHVHSLHHKSHNPGPWSGLSMHPIEHLMYYSCAWLLPLFFTIHPLHFLYAKFHADIAPIGGHDGYDEPSANGDFHWLHHAKFECNYGVPFPIDFDKIFGTWVDYKDFKAAGGKMPSKIKEQINARSGKPK